MGLFGPFCSFRPPPRGVFYINPSRRGPVPAPEPKKGDFPGYPRKGLKTAILADFRDFPPFRRNRLPGPQRTLPAPRAGDRAPARGVDVKPPSPGSPDPGSRVPRGPPGLWDPSGVRNGSGGPPRALPGPRAPRRPAPRGLFYINPSRRGPVPVPGPGGTSPDPGSGKPLRRGRGCPRPVQGRRDRAACAGRVRQQGGMRC